MTHADATIDEILFAFQVAHPRPTPADVADWIQRHPDHQAAIMEQAAILLEDALGSRNDTEPTEEALARGRSVAMDLLHQARSAARASGDPSARTGVSLSGLLASVNKTVPALAREIDAGREMLTDYVSGRMAPPVRRRLTNAVSQALGVAVSAVENAYLATLAAPIAMHAKADGTPVALRRPYDEVVKTDSKMTDERKAYWLSEG